MRYDFGLVAEGVWLKSALNYGAGGTQVMAAARSRGVSMGGRGDAMSVALGMSIAGGSMSVVSGLGMASI